jgi:hypothetical protein
MASAQPRLAHDLRVSFTVSKAPRAPIRWVMGCGAGVLHDSYGSELESAASTLSLAIRLFFTRYY